MADTVTYFSLQQLQPNPLQPRGSINADSLQDLVDSIKEHGILEPLVIAHTPAGYQIIAGERRWRAAQMAGLTEVPVLIKETTPQGMLEMAIVENVQRSDLNPIDRAKAFQRLMYEFNLNPSDISKRIAKSPAYVSNSIRLLSLPDALTDGLLSGLISEGHARALAAIEDTHLIIEAYKIILKENGSVRRAEELARKFRARAGLPQRMTVKPPLMVNAEIDAYQKMVTEKFGGEKENIVKISRSRAETKLSIAFKGNLEKTQERFQKLVEAIEKINMDDREQLAEIS